VGRTESKPGRPRAHKPMRSIARYTDEADSLLTHLHRPRGHGGMLTAKCTAILTMYAKRLEGEARDYPDQGLPRALRHVETMIPKAIEFFQQNRREKGFRWLGFIQGVLWTEGIYTVKQMKDHNRPDGQRKKQE